MRSIGVRSSLVFALAAGSMFADAEVSIPRMHRGYFYGGGYRRDMYRNARHRNAQRKAVAIYVKSHCKHSFTKVDPHFIQPQRNHCFWRRPG